MKRVLFFGIFDPEYSRTKVLAEGFKENGYEVVFYGVNPRSFGGWEKYKMLYKNGRELRGTRFNHVLVCFPGRVPVLVIARLLFGSRIIFDAFLSAYDSNVFDRKVYSAWSLRSWRDWLNDWASCHLAWKILLDTNEHIKYFVSTLGARKEKCIRVFVGADEKVFYSRDVVPSKILTVHFHGTFIPLQGTQYIIEAAHILANELIKFRIIGNGQESERVRERAKQLKLTNIEFIDNVPLTELPNYIALADVCLGIFGDTQKTTRVIPNKVFECLAMGKAIITADTPAIRELFGDNPPLVLVPRANPTALAEAILALMSSPERCRELGVKASEFFNTNLKAHIIIAGLLKNLS